MSFNGWKEVQLGEISKGIAYGYTESASKEKIGPKFLRITDIVGGLNWETVPYCKISPNNLKKYQLEIGDIVIARTGATTGTTAVIKEKQEAVFASYLIRYQIDQALADPFYVGHILTSTNWKEFVASIIGGSAQPGANAKQFASFRFLLPPLQTQKRIASILSSLDDKIELNRQTNQTLEAMAQALFTEMCLPKGEGLPAGWRVEPLSTIGKIVCGKTPSKEVKEYFGGQVPFVKIPNMHNKVFITSTEEMLTTAGADSQKNKFVPPYSIMVSCIATVGLVSITSEYSQTNQQINSIVPHNKFDTYFLYFKMVSLEKTLKDLGSGGSATLNVNTTTFSNILIEVPPVADRELIQNRVAPLFERILINDQENQTLTSLRDSLLPKLMKGKIEING